MPSKQQYKRYIIVDTSENSCEIVKADSLKSLAEEVKEFTEESGYSAPDVDNSIEVYELGKELAIIAESEGLTITIEEV